MNHLARTGLLASLLFASLEAAQSQAQAPPQGPPPILNGVGIQQNLGQEVPLDLEFVDSTGASMTLRDCMHGRPVLLMLVYYQCPMLCTTSLNQLARSLNVLS